MSVEHVNRHYKAGWLRAFAPASGVLRCVDTLDGAPCTHAALLDLRAGTRTGVGWEREVGTALERLHLDHTRGRCMLRVTGGARQCARRRGRGTTDWTARHCVTTCLVCVRFRWKRPAGIKLVNAAAIGEHELLAGAPGTWIR